MTKRDFMNAVIALAENNTDEYVTVLSSPKTVVETTEGVKVVTTRIYMSELINHAKAEIESLDKRNATRSSKPTKTQIENEGIKSKIMTILSNELMTASAIGEKVGISTQKASALCGQLASSGKIKVQELKVPKRGKQNGYSLIPNIEKNEIIE